jgi:indolepyruvate ferredoxin oxidoreductase alpha subunit
VAIFGDSSFFHLSLPAILSAAYNRAPILMLVLDNSATVTSGFQPNPGSGKDLRGGETRRLSIEDISRACGVDLVRTVGPGDGEETLRAAFRDGLAFRGLGLIVLRRPCDRVS